MLDLYDCVAKQEHRATVWGNGSMVFVPYRRVPTGIPGSECPTVSPGVIGMQNNRGTGGYKSQEACRQGATAFVTNLAF